MAQPSWIGQTLVGRYTIQEELGHGGMASVYKATDANLRRVVAIKLIHPHQSGSVEFVRRFESEATVVAQLRHPNIVQVYDFNKEGDTYFIVFEFVPGETLQARLKRLSSSGRFFSTEDAIKTTATIADALNYAHERDLIHRDVKPANIMINVYGEAILTDFGIAKIVGGTRHTATGAVLGTARYMSPEQIKGQRIDARTDIYSLGVVLYELLGGRPPFDAESAMTVLMKHISDPVPDVRRIRPEVPAGLVAVINRAMAKEPNDRFRSAAEMATALNEAGGGDTSTMRQYPGTAAMMGAGYAEAAELTGPKTVVEPTAPPDTGQRQSTSPTAPGTRQRTVVGTQPPGPTPAPTAQKQAKKKDSSSRWLLLAAGGLVILLILCIGAVGVYAIFSGGDGTPESGTEVSGGGEATATISGPATAGLITRTTQPEDPLPTEEATLPALIPTLENTLTSTPPPLIPTSTAPQPTLAPTTAPPTQTPTTAPEPTTSVPTVATLSVRITGITVENGRYVVSYETSGYTESLPGMHIHFFFDTVTPANAGVPGSGPWILYGGPRPFTEYGVSDRPGGANQMCALVANPDHSVQLGSGNCVTLPSG